MFINSSKLDSKCSTDPTRNCKIKIWEGEKGSDKESFPSCLSLSFIPPYPHPTSLLLTSTTPASITLSPSLSFFNMPCTSVIFSKAQLGKEKNMMEKNMNIFLNETAHEEKKYCNELFSLLKFQMYVPLGENIFQFQHKETVQGSNPPPE